MIRLKELREARGLSQLQIAKEINKSFQAYSHYETGKREPDFGTLVKLADFFGVTTDYILGRDLQQNEKMSLPLGRERLIEEINNADDETAKEIEQYLNYLKAKKEQAATGTER